MPTILRTRSAPLAGLLLACATAAAAGQTDPQTDPRARLFIERGCTECHAVVGLGVKAKTDVGPDLTYAYADVRHRYGLRLEQFLEQPVGTMRMVVGGEHVRLADRDSLIRVLRALYADALADSRDECAVPPGRAAATPRREDP